MTCRGFKLESTELTHFDESIKVLGIGDSLQQAQRPSDWGLGKTTAKGSKDDWIRVLVPLK